MREARAREFALGIGKGDGICSRHGAMIEVVRKNCSHERCTEIAIKGDYCENHSKRKKNGNKGKRKSESDLQRELDHFTAENIHNLDHFKQAYRNQQNARYFIERRLWRKPYEEAEAYEATIRENKEFASKQKKIINLESAIRRKRHQEVGYCRDERCRRNYCREERRKEIHWSEEDDIKLWSLRSKALSQLSRTFNRTTGAVRSRLIHLQDPTHKAYQRRVKKMVIETREPDSAPRAEGAEGAESV